MSKRAKFDVELVKAEAELAHAETDVIKAIIRAQAKADADLANPIAALDSARTRCQRARANWHGARLRADQLLTELAELNDAQTIDKSGARTDKLIREMLENPELGASASPSSTQSSEYPVRTVEKHQERVSHGRKLVGSLGILRRKYRVPGGAPARRLMVRRSVMLFALVLAYLQYYFLDVHLQIARLPSVTVFT